MSPLGLFGQFLESGTDARPLAVARVIIGGAAFLRGLVSYHLFDLVLTPGVIQARALEWVPEMTRGAMPWYTGLWLFVSAAFTLGYRTRLNGSILVALIVYHLAADVNFFWSHIYFLGCLILLLTAANAGADLSFDWSAAGGGRKIVPQWGVVLLKLHVSIVYFVAALAKLNPEFLSGAVVGRGILHPEFLKTPEALIAMAVGTVVFEAAMAFALWLKPLRLWAIGAGIIFHALIPGTLGFYGGLVVFSASIIGTYIVFLDAEEFAAAERSILRVLKRTGFPSRLQGLLAAE